MMNIELKNITIFRFDVDDETIFGGCQDTTIQETIRKWHSSLAYDIELTALTVHRLPNHVTCKIMIAVTAKMTQADVFAYRLKYPTAHLVAQ